MTIQDLLKEKELSRYKLSKMSGVPWATLADICSGKTKMEKCNVITLLNLSKALNLSVEELLTLKAEPDMYKGKPKDKTYLETDLPLSIQKAIEDYIEGEKENVLHLDCLWGELYGAINASQWDNSITTEQADYLRKKYLFGGEESETDD